MKNALIIALAVLGLNLGSMAKPMQADTLVGRKQKTSIQVNAAGKSSIKSNGEQKAQRQKEQIQNSDAIDTINVVTIQSLSETLDKFIAEQSKTNSRLEKKINSLGSNLHQVSERSSLRFLANGLIPIVVMIVLGGLFVLVVYVISNTRFRNNKLKYEAMVKCAETTGSVPEVFAAIDRARSLKIPVSGRIHLILSILCGFVGTIFVITAINLGDHKFMKSVFCLGSGVVFGVLAIKLYIQFSKISEDSRQEE